MNLTIEETFGSLLNEDLAIRHCAALQEFLQMIFENGQQWCRHETAFNQSHTLRGIGSDDRRQELTSSKEDESAVLLIKVVDVLFPLP